MTTTLFADAWVTLTLDGDLVRYTRTALPYATLAELDASFAGVGGCLLQIKPHMKLLLDMRLAPPRNDAAFEKRSLSAVDNFTKRFAKIATLVKTAVGKLQTARLAKERGSLTRAFDDEQAALAYLAAS